MDKNITNRAESYYEYALLKRNNFPKPVTREDFYLLALAEQVRLGTGGGAVDSIVADWGKTTVTVGKLNAGTNTDGKTAIQILESMLRGFVNATCSVNYSEVNTTLELGTSFNLTITANNFRAGDGACERVSLYKNGSLVEEKLIESASSVSFTTINNITTNTSFEVKLTDAKGVTTSVSKKSYQFVGATYTGVLSDIPTTADEVIALIDTIGEVTLDSRDVIVNTKAAYDELTYDQQQLVENKETLKEAVVAFNELVNEYNENLEEDEEKLELIEEINDKTKFDDFLDSIKNNKALTAITVILGTVLGGFLIYGLYKLISKFIKWVKR